MSALLLTVFLAAAPLEVRVLERERPRMLELSASALTCNGAAVDEKSARVETTADGLKLGARACATVGATGATVKLEGLSRAFPGLLELSLEKNLIRLINKVDVDDYLPSVLAAEADGKV